MKEKCQAVTGKEVTNKHTLPGHSRHTGAIAFEPSAGAGEYLLRGICVHNLATIFHVIMGLNSVYTLPE
jgi:hypothetical protein